MFNTYEVALLQMVEYDGSDKSYRDSTNDQVALMSRNFKQMMKKKGKFHHSSRRKDTGVKKKYKEKGNEINCFNCRKLGHMKA